MSDRSTLIFTTDPERMDVARIHGFLSRESYWARGIPLDIVRRSMANSICFGIMDGERQAAFARVVTDRATFAYLCDLFVVPEYRGRGLSKWLMEEIMAYPELRGLRRWNLVTRDAHTLYEQFGFASPANPGGYMERRDPHVYERFLAEGGD